MAITTRLIGTLGGTPTIITGVGAANQSISIPAGAHMLAAIMDPSEMNGTVYFNDISKGGDNGAAVFTGPTTVNVRITRNTMSVYVVKL